MKKLLYLLVFLPFLAGAQVTGSIQKTPATGTIRGNFGANGIDTLQKAITVSTLSSTPNTNGLSLSAAVLRGNKMSHTTTGFFSTSTDTVPTGTKKFSNDIWVMDDQIADGHVGISSGSGSLMAPLIGSASETSTYWMQILAHPASNLYNTNPTDGIIFQVYNNEGPDPITAGNSFNFKNGTNSLLKILYNGDMTAWGGMSSLDNRISNGSQYFGSASGSLMSPSIAGDSETSSAWFKFNGGPATNIDNTNPTDAFAFTAYKSKDGSSGIDGGNLVNFYNKDVSKFKVAYDGAITAKAFNMSDATASTDAVFDGSKNLISNTITGSGSGVRATSPTLATSLTLTTGTNNVKWGSTSNYGYTSYNGSTSLTGMTGVFGGASGDASTLYLQAPTGGLIDLRVAGSDALTVSGSAVTISSLGTGAVQATAGVLSVSSDSRLKDLHGKFKGSALQAINSLAVPQYWNYNKKSKLGENAYKVNQFGLLADQVHEKLGEEFAPTQGVYSKDGKFTPTLIDGKETYGLSDRALLSLVIQALQEQKEIVEKQDARILYLEKQLIKP